MGTCPLITDEAHITERVTKPQSWNRRCQLVPSSLTPQPAYPAAFHPGLPGTALGEAINPTVVCPFVITTNHVSQLPKRFWNSDLLAAYRPRWGGPPCPQGHREATAVCYLWPRLDSWSLAWLPLRSWKVKNMTCPDRSIYSSTEFPFKNCCVRGKTKTSWNKNKNQSLGHPLCLTVPRMCAAGI